MIYCISCVRWTILLVNSNCICLRWTLTRRLFRGPSSRNSCSWIVTEYLAFLDGSIGKDAVVAAMMNNKKEKEEGEEGEDGAVRVLNEQWKVKTERKATGGDDGPDNPFLLAPWIAFVPGPVKARELRIGPKHYFLLLGHGVQPTGQYLPAESIYWLGRGKSSFIAFLTSCNHVTGTPHLPDRVHVCLCRPFSLSSLDTCMSITKLPLQKTAWCSGVMLCQPMEGPPPQYFGDGSPA